jgi:hypothetical protein
MPQCFPDYVQLPGKPFYEKFAYEIVADIPDYPKGHSHHVLKKTLV